MDSVKELFKKYWAEFFTGLFFCFALLGIFHHEMWRDEMQAWLISRNSRSLPELTSHIRFESHPHLWYILLSFLGWLWPDPLSMQLLGIIIAAISAYLFLKKAPFAVAHKLLFILGYYPFYEYCVISRNYGLCSLWLFTFCILFASGLRHYLLLSIPLILLCFSHFLGVLWAGVISLFLIAHFFSTPQVSRGKLYPFLASGLLLAAAAVYCLYVVSPHPDNMLVHGHFHSRPFHIVAKDILKGFVPGLLFSIPAWLHWTFASALFFSSFFIFLTRPIILVPYLIYASATVIFVSQQHQWANRHAGFLFILFIGFIWLSRVLPESKEPARLSFLNKFLGRFQNYFLTLLLCVHAAVGLNAYSRDWRLNFSGAKQTAEYIQDHKLTHLSIVGDTAFILAVSGYLDKPIYYPRNRKWQTFYDWSTPNALRRTRWNRFRPQAEALAAKEKRDVLLLLNYRLQKDELKNILPLKRFRSHIYRSETFYLYRLKYTPPAR